MMLKLIEQGTCPEYVSIGNEMQYGLLYNNHKNNNGFYNKSDYLTRFVNAGARLFAKRHRKVKSFFTVTTAVNF